MEPVAAQERVVSIDTVRGAALAGVLLINLLSCFRAPLSAHILGLNDPLGPGGSLLLALATALIEFKAFTLFSFLFGVGVAIQTQRATAGKSTAFLLRRFGALLAIGALHLLLVWNGDILTLYGLCGLLLIPMLRLSDSAIAMIGLLLVIGPNLIPIPVRFPDNAVLRELTAGALHAYRSGSWQELLSFRWHRRSCSFCRCWCCRFQGPSV